ncbi:MAG: aminotransferase class I/II-fold pyridoxal phosphate-dependent enzyme [Gemmatimonadaceae bacterium]|nr:aminotransferase class I/II-fold pyridoxal phosphate-dependent enzyme [Gemmatimonadaceae bacterium]
MSLSRRAFLASVGAGSAGVMLRPIISARGAEALLALGRPEPGDPPAWSVPPASLVRIDSNENPNGPGDRVFAAVRDSFGVANRYPRGEERAALDAIAAARGVKVENLMLGCGSTEILRVATAAFAGPGRALVQGSPTFEVMGRFAPTVNAPVRNVPVDAKLRLDLDAMASAAKGAGVVYLCNPNNPTATVLGAAAVRQFVEQVAAASPATVVLIDEAYHEYVDDPSYATAIPLALENPNVVVARTFSKVYGMAGLRLGYAIARPETLKRMRPWLLETNTNQPALAGATVTVADTGRIADEQRLNRSARAFTLDFFRNAGYATSDSQANFVMVDIRRDVKTFKAECLKQGVSLGRPFPPLNTHLRVSIGTMAEMQRAVEVIRGALA